jgi:hypothetical protein
MPNGTMRAIEGAMNRKAHPNAVNARIRELLAQISERGFARTCRLSYGHGLPEAVRELARRGYLVTYNISKMPASGFEPAYSIETARIEPSN